VRNTLFTVQAIARVCLSGAAVGAHVRDAFEGRLGALAVAHGLLAKETWKEARIREIVKSALRPFGMNNGGSGRFSVEGGDFLAAPKAAVALAPLFHELASNAAKYGALSVDAGGERFRLHWQECGGPPVNPPAGKGFGLQLIERVLTQDLEADVQLAYPPNGVTCSIVMPLPAISHDGVE